MYIIEYIYYFNIVDCIIIDNFSISLGKTL